jgi:hypothetical protein
MKMRCRTAQKLLGLGLSLFGIEFSKHNHRQFNILICGECCQQVKRLKNEADFFESKARQVAIIRVCIDGRP